jgi:hypothetical protein
MKMLWDNLVALVMLLAMFSIATLYVAHFVHVFFHNLRVHITHEGSMYRYR